MPYEKVTDSFLKITVEKWTNDEGQNHREDDLPAIITSEGTRKWYVNGKLHREGGLPAVEWRDGTMSWWIDGQLHREDGPAVLYTDGFREWFLSGEKLTEEQFVRHVELIRQNNVLVKAAR